MKYVEEFRDATTVRRLVATIANRVTRPWVLMEVCGGQTHSIIRHGIDQLLPPCVELLHGPGCPVCVTPVDVIDQAIAIASRPGVTFCTFGDMLRVPGTCADLYRVKANGGDVRVVHSPLDAVRIAEQFPDREVVMLAIGFETTAPANAMAIVQAKRRGLRNFSALVSHVLVPPALRAMQSSATCRVNAYLAAGHVCCITGVGEYDQLCQEFGIPIVVTGFEPLDILDGIARAIGQLERGVAVVENAYQRAVSPAGNILALRTLADVFEVTDRQWRGIGRIAGSGWRLRPEYREFDAELRFNVEQLTPFTESLCRSGEVLTGAIKPTDCAAFGSRCTPHTPLGATMVSGEGACAAYYNYRRFQSETPKV